MSAVLLDTQVLIWSLLDDPRRSEAAIQLIEASDTVFVSAASIYEIDFKRRDPARLRARDSVLARMPDDMPDALPRLGLTLLPIGPDVAWTAARLPIDHGDPWDRILLAQAMILKLPLISADTPLRQAADSHRRTRGVVFF